MNRVTDRTSFLNYLQSIKIHKLFTMKEKETFKSEKTKRKKKKMFSTYM